MPTPIHVLCAGISPVPESLADGRFTVRNVSDAASALAAVRNPDQPVDCVVSAYDLADSDGIDLLNSVRETAGEVPFVLYPAAGSEHVASAAIEAGVSAYIPQDDDTTDRLRDRVETAVSEREAATTRANRYRRLVEESTDVVAIVDTDGRFKYVSPRVESLLGYQPAELVSESGFSYIHPDDHNEATEALAELVSANNSTMTVEFRFQHADGSWVWIEARTRNLLTDEAVEGVVVYARDVTDRHHREQQLSELHDVTKRLLAAEDATGVADAAVGAAKDVLGLEVAGVYFEENSSLRPVAITEVARELFDEIPTLTAGGSLAWRVYDSGEPMFTEDVSNRPEAHNPDTPIRSEMILPLGEMGVFLAGSTTQAAFSETDRMLAEVLASNTETALGAVTTQSLLRDREMKLNRLQERTRRLMYTETAAKTAEVAVEAASEVIDTPLNSVHLLDETGETLEVAAASDAVREAVGGPVPAYERDAPTGTTDAFIWETFEAGEPRYVPHASEHDPPIAVSFTESIVTHPVGDHGVFTVAAREPNAFDSTDQALFEVLATALTAALDRVERESRLRSRTEQLQRQNERLDNFASIVSHDLQNPLSVASGYVELLSEDVTDDRLDKVSTALDRMEELVDDLLALARSDTGDLDLERVSLGDAVRRASASITLTDAAIEVESNRTLSADSGLFGQLLENLLRNSVEHGSTSDRSGTRDTDDKGGVTIRVGTLPNGFYVADDGPGIPPDQREQVFQHGFSTDSGGTGLGLAIVRTVAEMHGWSVSVTDSESGGARFEITGVDFA